MLLQKEKQSIEEIFYSPKRVGNIFGQMQKNILEKFLL